MSAARRFVLSRLLCPLFSAFGVKVRQTVALDDAAHSSGIPQTTHYGMAMNSGHLRFLFRSLIGIAFQGTEWRRRSSSPRYWRFDGDCNPIAGGRSSIGPFFSHRVSQFTSSLATFRVDSAALIAESRRPGSA